MVKKKVKFTTAFKTKIVLEALKSDKTLSEIAVEYNVNVKNIQNWKRQFLENAEIAMEPSKAVTEYKVEIENLQKKNDEYAKTVGKLTVELDWATKKLKSLDLSKKKRLVDSKLNIPKTRQCELLDFNRASLYYKSQKSDKEMILKQKIMDIFYQNQSYGIKKVHHQLLKDGYQVCENTVAKYRKELGLKAILGVKKFNTTSVIKEHKKYSYKLKDLEINRANQVWSTDITYIKMPKGSVYMAAIIDWHSKAILSYEISNTMDKALVMDVLNSAILKYGKPDILNSDQGSQYTSSEHTDTLKSHNITISMNGKGRSIDNIAIERFWRTIKCENLYLNEYYSMRELKNGVKEFVEYYNYERFHQSLNYKTPMEIYYKNLSLNSKNMTLKLEKVI